MSQTCVEDVAIFEKAQVNEIQVGLQNLRNVRNEALLHKYIGSCSLCRDGYEQEKII